MKKIIPLLALLTLLGTNSAMAEEAKATQPIEKPKVDLNAEIAAYSKTIRSNPDDADAYYKRGNVYAKQQQYEQAMADYQHAISLRPLFADAYGSFGWALIEQGQFAKAQPYCQKAYQLDKTSFAKAVNLGHTYLLQGDAKTARGYYQESLTLVDDQESFEQGPVADFDLFIKNGWQTAAVETEKQWMQVNFAKMQPTLQKINDLNKQADAYYEKGEYEKAEPLWIEVLTLREKLLGKEHFKVATSLKNLALLYDKQGKYDQAIP